MLTVKKSLGKFVNLYMAISAAAAALLGSASQSGTNLIGNIIGNRARRRESRTALQAGQIQHMQQFGENQMLWNQQNQYNQQLWNQQNAYDQSVWEMQNKYNSPQEQMARYVEAGLNPHLIYGQGTPGNAQPIATQSIGTNNIQSPDVANYNPAQVDNVLNGVDAFGNYIRMRQLNAQVDNIEANTDVARQEALVKAQDRVLKSLNIRRGEVQYDIDRKIADTTVSAAEENLRLLQHNVTRAASEAHVSVNTQDERVQQAQIDVNHALQQLRGQALLNELRRIELNLNKHGVQKGDHVILRMLMQPENYKWLDKIKDLF